MIQSRGWEQFQKKGPPGMGRPLVFGGVSGRGGVVDDGPGHDPEAFHGHSEEVGRALDISGRHGLPGFGQGRELRLNVFQGQGQSGEGVAFGGGHAGTKSDSPRRVLSRSRPFHFTRNPSGSPGSAKVRPCRLETLATIAAALGVRVKDLFTEE